MLISVGFQNVFFLLVRWSCMQLSEKNNTSERRVMLMNTGSFSVAGGCVDARGLKKPFIWFKIKNNDKERQDSERVRETVGAQSSAVTKEAKGFQNLCERNSVGNKTQTFLCMPEQSRTPEIATLAPPPNHTRELGPRWKPIKLGAGESQKIHLRRKTGVKAQVELARVRVCMCVFVHAWVRACVCAIAVRPSFFHQSHSQMEERHHARFPFPIPLFKSFFWSFHIIYDFFI